jgi:hypothetical protein
MQPNYELAAIKAVETLLKYNLETIPVNPLPVIRKQPNVLVLSFLELSSAIGVHRDTLLSACGEENQDAVTTVHTENGAVRYLIAYNQKLPDYQINMALARELGHIILGHDGSRPEEVRNEEALCFAYHFICPCKAIMKKVKHDD